MFWRQLYSVASFFGERLHEVKLMASAVVLTGLVLLLLRLESGYGLA